MAKDQYRQIDKNVVILEMLTIDNRKFFVPNLHFINFTFYSFEANLWFYCGGSKRNDSQVIGHPGTREFDYGRVVCERLGS